MSFEKGDYQMDEQISLLIIDDDRMVRQILERSLSQRG